MTNENNVKNTVEELKKLLNSQSAIGEPIETEDKIIIPIMRMGFGFSAAEGFGQKLGGNGSAGAAGVEPVSMVVITKGMEGIEGIRVLNLSKGTATNKALTDLGLVITDVIKDFRTNKSSDKVVDVQDADINEKTEPKEPEKETVKINIDEDQ